MFTIRISIDDLLTAEASSASFMSSINFVRSIGSGSLIISFVPNNNTTEPYTQITQNINSIKLSLVQTHFLKNEQTTYFLKRHIPFFIFQCKPFAHNLLTMWLNTSQCK